jgi:transcriptional regulator with XRE-family HTH domain
MLGVTRDDIDPILRRRLAGWLRWHFKRLDITQEEMARRLGMHQSALSKILLGDREVGMAVFVGLTSLGLDATVMLTTDPPDPTSLEPLPPKMTGRAAAKHAAEQRARHSKKR